MHHFAHEPTPGAYYHLQVQMREKEGKRGRQHRQIIDIKDDIFRKRDALITAQERRMRQTTQSDILFTIRWSVV